MRSCAVLSLCVPFQANTVTQVKSVSVDVKRSMDGYKHLNKKDANEPAVHT